MLDHVSMTVADLVAAERFHEASAMAVRRACAMIIAPMMRRSCAIPAAIASRLCVITLNRRDMR